MLRFSAGSSKTVLVYFLTLSFELVIKVKKCYDSNWQILVSITNLIFLFLEQGNSVVIQRSSNIYNGASTRLAIPLLLETCLKLFETKNQRYTETVIALRFTFHHVLLKRLNRLLTTASCTRADQILSRYQVVGQVFFYI